MDDKRLNENGEQPNEEMNQNEQPIQNEQPSESSGSGSCRQMLPECIN